MQCLLLWLETQLQHLPFNVYMLEDKIQNPSKCLFRFSLGGYVMDQACQGILRTLNQSVTGGNQVQKSTGKPVARSVQDLLADGNTLNERRFGEPFQCPVILFGAMVECHSIMLKTCRDCISSARKSYQEYSLAMHCADFWSQTLRNWKRWTHMKAVLKDSNEKEC